jgi:murein peptide amidase A
MRIAILCLMTVGLMFFGGCGDKPDFGDSRKCAMEFDRGVCGRSVNGEIIDFYTFGQGEQTILYIASIHGDEQAGTPLMGKLIDYLSENGACELASDKRVVIVPKINPDGYDAQTRFNANGIDLNRNFPAANRENNPVNGLWAFSEPESRTIATLIDIYRPQKILVFHEPLDCIDYDGPAEEYARYLGVYCDLPVKKLGARPGSLGAYAGETLGIETITVEFPKNVRGKDADYMWEKYGQMVLAAFRR